MSNGYHVDAEQLRAHARNIEALQARFEAVKSADSHIVQGDEAYGLRCGWLAGVLEQRHITQDELIACAEENLTLMAEALRKAANDTRPSRGTTSILCILPAVR
jgi:hypothetical protein